MSRTSPHQWLQRAVSVAVIALSPSMAAGQGFSPAADEEPSGTLVGRLLDPGGYPARAPLVLVPVLPGEEWWPDPVVCPSSERTTATRFLPVWAERAPDVDGAFQFDRLPAGSRSNWKAPSTSGARSAQTGKNRVAVVRSEDGQTTGSGHHSSPGRTGTSTSGARAGYPPGSRRRPTSVPLGSSSAAGEKPCPAAMEGESAMTATETARWSH